MYRIGFIIDNKHLFSNGLMQNAYFLYQIYTYLGNKCTLLSCDPVYKQLKGLDTVPVKTISIHPSEFDTSEYDVIFTIGMGVSKPIYESCKRTNTHVIGFTCGNILADTITGFVDDTASSSSNLIGKDTPVDKLWLIEGHRYMKTFLELTRGKSVNLVRHTWSPELLEMFSKKRNNTSLFYKHTLPAEKVNIVILEPNMEYVKSAVIPFTICEYLNQKKSEIINQVFIFNWNDSSKTAQHLAATFEVSKKTRFFKSLLIDEILNFFNSQPHPFIVVSHQLNNPWNYVYYEMLYYGIPLVHNSPDFRQLGYYYSDTNIEEGADAVMNAIQYHMKLHPLQKPKISKLLDSMNPSHPECQTYWKELLEAEIFTATQKRILNIPAGLK